ncbi:unnamed protein product [Moneuplotes crassus]|uniref:Methyltransferase type 11 domain-containing protein n=1 Tax=Euplotes crassus TaxID=5936 RepID=A0AAD2D1X0_EUPCR|nr:unnamed protein product [Moneuplotes crassus]
MEVNEEATEKQTKMWNSFSKTYEDSFENITIQSSVILYSLTKAKKFSKICEVGVGCGLASRMFIANIMKKGAFYFCSDFSDEMNRIYYEHFQECDTAFNPKVKLEWIKDSEAINVTKKAEDMGEDIEKKLFLHQANNEKLPYPDESFDLYLSSLSLMLVDNYMNQLKEAYRVLEKGGVAGFTVHGKPENCNYLSFVPDVIKSLGHEIPPATTKPITHLCDKDSLHTDLTNVGFTIIKTFYTNINMLFDDVMILFDSLIKSPILKNLVDNLTEDQKEELFVEMKKQWEIKYGPETTEVQEWQILVCIVTK